MSATGTTWVLMLARPEPGAIELVTRSLPTVAADEVLVHILAAGICGTDLCEVECVGLILLQATGSAAAPHYDWLCHCPGRPA
jgi:hypothetical protein